MKAITKEQRSVKKNTDLKKKASKNSRNKRSEQIYKLSVLGLLSAITFIMAFTPIGYIPVGALKLTFLTIPVIVAAALIGPAGGAIIGGMFGITSFIQACSGMSVLTGALFQLNPVLTFILCIVPRVLEGFLGGLVFKGLQKSRESELFSYISNGALIGIIAGLGIFCEVAVINHFHDDMMSAFFLSIILTIVLGTMTGLLFGFIRKVKYSDVFAYAATALSVPLLNTILFMSALYAEIKIIAMNANAASGLDEGFAATFTAVSGKSAGGVLSFFVGMVGAQAIIEAVVCFIVGSAITKALAVALKRVKK